MGHAGHFIMGSNCQFRLNTYVNGYIVSTVGELKYGGDKNDYPFRPLGAASDSLYETFVFKAKKSQRACCPWEMADASEIDSQRYSTAEAAARGHEEMLTKWESE
jgi:hypothetical protein